VTTARHETARPSGVEDTGETRPSRQDPVRTPGRARAILVGVGSVYLTLVTLIPIVITPYRHDDTINHNAPAIWRAAGQPILSALLQETSAQVHAWMSIQGRFFPGSALWSFSVFSLFQTRTSYKLFLGFLCLVMIGLAAWLVATLTREVYVASVVVIGLVSTLTLRMWADGLDSFSGLLPFTISLALGSSLLLLRGRGRTSVIAALVLWSIALVTYEVAAVVVPFICLALFLARRGKGRSLALLWPTLADGAFVYYLRSRATGIAPAYQTGFEPHRVFVTYVKQTVAALPLSQVWFPGSTGPVIAARLVAAAIVLVGLPAAVVLIAVRRSRPVPSWRSLGIGALIGGAFMLAPPVLVAITVRWQETLPRGQGYLSVVWGYVGVAVLFAVAWLAVAKRSVEHPGLGGRVAMVAATTILSLLAALTAAQSFAIALAFAFPPG
jgi:hypothetical protein